MAQIGIERLTGLIAFARAASLGSYTAAARALAVSPSAVSKSVQRLEQQLGIVLFLRTTRSLTLTPEGRDLHDRALRLLRQAEDIEQAAMAARAEPSGILRISAPLPVGVHILGPALPRLRARHPKLAIDLRLGDQFVDMIEEGIDVAIRVGALADSRLKSRRLASHRLCAFASPEYLRRRGTPRHPDELAGHDCVNFRFQSSGQTLRWPFASGKRVFEATPEIGITVDTSDGVAAVLVAGGGVGISPTYIAAPYVKRGELVPILAAFAVDRSSMMALWPESRRANPNVKAFLTFLDEVFPARPPWDEVVFAGQ
ncbi:LysR family transcriptional regulator [Rhizobium lentis]|uniref:LysR family transcriptional regulator n=1 Tax=Rhizobium lentis TaxID=1138194 RepID=UPI001A928C19|nr:LysR family transcriptional regulator [Rhizobium lentis]MBX5067322.1 LysR family transcriptional regulator [Rhizobium lentis]MBX5078229.1 LysR family transcriptional regulator [Rhizobium lentis]MBX5104449.1 LysR family transcriptional regulator [Rhizobium lentis]QSW95814.1 LysR family transcriptional regulator [Rhizobium lentis]